MPDVSSGIVQNHRICALEQLNKNGVFILIVRRMRLRLIVNLERIAMSKNKIKKYNATVTLKVVVAVDGDNSPDEIIRNETDFLAEPKSANGCVVAINVKDVTINK